MATSAIKIFRPDSVALDDGYSAAGSGSPADEVEACDPGDPVSHDDDISYAAIGSGSVSADLHFAPDTGFSEKMALVEKVEVFARAERTSSNTFNSYQHIIEEPDTTINVGATTTLLLNTWDTQSHDFTAVRSWVEDDFRDADFSFGFRGSSAAPAMRFTSSWCEVTYLPEEQLIDVWRESTSRRIRQLRLPEEFYSLKVPLEFLVMELFDDLNISHSHLPRSASHLSASATMQLVESWRRMYGRLSSSTIALNDLSMTLGFVNREPQQAVFWSTEIVPDVVDENNFGLAQMDNGQLETMDRNSLGYLFQSDGKIATVKRSRKKYNHKGFIAEPAATNEIQNPSFAAGATDVFTDWTKNVGTGGTITEDTTDLGFVDETSYPRSVVFEKGSSGDCFLDQGSISAVAGDGDYIVSVVYKNDGGATTSWRLQRSSDSNYWNDGSESWGASATWNTLATSASDIARGFSNPITATTTTYTLDVGITGGLENDTMHVYQVDLTDGPFRLQPIANPLSGATTAVVVDERSRVRSALPQVYNPERGTARLTFEAVQDGADLSNGDKMVLLYWQIGATTSDYDILTYEKSSGNNVRFEFERVISSSVDATAFADVTIVPGTTYEIACRWTSTEGELGLSNRTLSVFVDGTKGTDDAATANHSTATAATEFWVGTSPSSLSLLPCLNFISDIEVKPIVLPDESILAYR